MGNVPNIGEATAPDLKFVLNEMKRTDKVKVSFEAFMCVRFSY